MKIFGKLCYGKTKVMQRFFASSKLADTQLDVEAICKKFVEKELAPVAARLDEEEHFPTEQITQLAHLGLMGMTAPVKYGGLELDLMSVSKAVEELSRGCASTGAIVSIHNILYADLLSTHGTDEQKKQFLEPYTKGIPGAFALSESDAGSDVANISTIAMRKGDCFLLNGSKTWVTSGIEAEVGIVFATIDKARKHRGITAFLVPLDKEGVERGKPDKKLGIRASSTCQINLNNVTVPIENVIGEVGGGFKMAMQQLNKARVGIASQALGIARASLDTALEYASNRRAFGEPLKNLQAVQLRLARMCSQIEVARLLVRKSAELCDNGENFVSSSAMAKLIASEAATFVSHQCIQIMGGMGYIRDMPAERYYRDARVTEIYGGVSDIQMMIIAEQLLKEFEAKKQCE